MASWIDTLKREKDKEAEAQARADDLRLLKAKIIQAKARDWFALLLASILADCEEMLAKFPNEGRYNPFVDSQTHGGFSLNGGGMPRRILRLDLQVNAQQISVCENMKQEFTQKPFPQESTPIRITVGTQEELRFHFRAVTHDTPESLAQHLVSYVCGIRGNSARP
jgi:hypothetical protein